MTKLFQKVRENIIGINQTINSPFGKNLPIIYADWTASGRNYAPIEKRLQEHVMPFVANTHTETNATGMAMTFAYHEAQKSIKKHINATSDDVLICCGSGMTGVINKFQRILGLRIHESLKDKVSIDQKEKPVIFITHMEHHSNQTSWLETMSDVVVIPPDENCLVCLDSFAELLKQYEDRSTKIAAITSCSNVTGIFTPYYEIAKMMHQVGGKCFVDFACSAPYVDIDMHPEDELCRLDAVYFSPHKFLGGPGSPGVLCFSKELYKNTIPDNPGGGTVNFTNPWGVHDYIEDIEVREDGGTPGFLQTIKAAMAMQLKDQMGVQNIIDREKELMNILWNGLEDIEGVHILAGNQKERLGILSFFVEGLHFNLVVKMLNDRFGIQTRGGCSCAGTYGHYLLNIDQATSKEIYNSVKTGNCSIRPGWVRMSIHPTTTNDEAHAIINGIKEVVKNHKEWIKDYEVNWLTGAVQFKDEELDNYVKLKMQAVFSDKLV